MYFKLDKLNERNIIARCPKHLSKSFVYLVVTYLFYTVSRINHVSF